MVRDPNDPLGVGDQDVYPGKLARSALRVVDYGRFVGVPGKCEVVGEKTVGHHGRASLITESTYVLNHPTRARDLCRPVRPHSMSLTDVRMT